MTDQTPPSTFHHGEISLRGLRIELQSVEFGETSLVLTVIVPDRDNGRPTPLTFTLNFDRTESAEEYAKQVHRAVTWIIGHEVAELLLVNGRRDEPHAGRFEFTIDITKEMPHGEREAKP